MSLVAIPWLTVVLTGCLVSLGLSSWLLSRSRTFGVLKRTPEFHHTPASERIPRLGGIAIVGGFLATSFAAASLLPDLRADASRFQVLACCSVAMFAVGILDDLRGLGARRKLLLQTLLSAAAWGFGFRIEQVQLPLLDTLVQLGPLAFLVTLFWLVAMTNLINLIDGIDGLAGGIGVLLMALLAWVGWGSGHPFHTLVCLGLGGALLGFLRFNFPPARIYMGDGGAYFLGFFIGLFSIETSNKGTVAAALGAPVVALALPILDTALALVRRASKGLPLFRPDQDHIHHRLLRRVGDKRRVLLLLYCLCAVATGFGLALHAHSGRHMAILTGAAGVVVVWTLQQLHAMPRVASIWPILQAHFRLRRHSRQLLRLTASLQSGAAKSRSFDELWDHYEKLATQLGVDAIITAVEGRRRSWHSPSRSGQEAAWHRRYSWRTPRHIDIEFFGRPERLTQDEFEHVSNLAGEAWHKAVLCWMNTAANEGDSGGTHTRVCPLDPPGSHQATPAWPEAHPTCGKPPLSSNKSFPGLPCPYSEATPSPSPP